MFGYPTLPCSSPPYFQLTTHRIYGDNFLCACEHNTNNNTINRPTLSTDGAVGCIKYFKTIYRIQFDTPDLAHVNFLISILKNFLDGSEKLLKS